MNYCEIEDWSHAKVREEITKRLQEINLRSDADGLEIENLLKKGDESSDITAMYKAQALAGDIRRWAEEIEVLCNRLGEEE